jgi:ribosome-associated translation inhibitor RaiA
VFVYINNSNIIDTVNTTRKDVKYMVFSISGIEDEDDFIKGVINEEIERAIEKLDKMLPVLNFIVRVKKYHKEGKRVKYSVHARLLTDAGDFFTNDFGWEPAKAVKGTLEKLEKEVLKKSEKMKDSKKA